MSVNDSLLCLYRLRLISIIFSWSYKTSLYNWPILRSFSMFYARSLLSILTFTNSAGIYFRRSMVKSPILVCYMLKDTTLLYMAIFLALRTKKSRVKCVTLPLPRFLPSSCSLSEEYPSQMVWLFFGFFYRFLVAAKLFLLVVAGDAVRHDAQACFCRARVGLTGFMRLATSDRIFTWRPDCEEAWWWDCWVGLFVERGSIDYIIMRSTVQQKLTKFHSKARRYPYMHLGEDTGI